MGVNRIGEGLNISQNSQIQGGWLLEIGGKVSKKWNPTLPEQLSRREKVGKILETFEIVNDLRLHGYQKRLASMAYEWFMNYKNQLKITQNQKTISKINLNIWIAVLANMQLISRYNKETTF